MINTEVFNSFPMLETDRLMLAKPDLSATGAVFEMRSNKEVMRYVPRPMMTEEQQAAELINLWIGEFAAQRGIVWMMMLKDSNRFVGNIGFWRMQPEHFRGEVGYMMHPAWNGKGLATEALQAIMNFGFEHMGFHSVEGVINPHNVASARVLEKCGFVKEAHFRENFFWNEVFEDTAIYSKLRA